MDETSPTPTANAEHRIPTPPTFSYFAEAASTNREHFIRAGVGAGEPPTSDISVTATFTPIQRDLILHLVANELSLQATYNCSRVSMLQSHLLDILTIFGRYMPYPGTPATDPSP